MGLFALNCPSKIMIMRAQNIINVRIEAMQVFADRVRPISCPFAVCAIGIQSGGPNLRTWLSSSFYLGPHAPRLTAKEIDLLHNIWLELSNNVAPERSIITT